MRAGRLRHRATVERPIRSQDSTGDEIITWTLVAIVWAEVRPSTTRMRERMAANQVLADMDTVINLRYSPSIAAIDPTWRLRLNSITYNIVGAANVDMRNREIEVMCVSGTNNG